MSEQHFERLMLSVNRAVFKERYKQNLKFGHQRHSMGEWLQILIEEVGEAAQAMQKGTVQYKETDAEDLFIELIQVAAVASAMAEQELERLKPGGVK